MNRIAVIKGASIGDAVLSFPLLRNIRRNFHDAEIYFITGEATSGIELLKTCPYIDKLEQFQKNTLKGRIKNAYKLLRLRRKRFDIVFDGAPSTEKSKKLCKLINARKHIEIKDYSIHKPIIEMDLSMLKDNGMNTDDGHTELFFEKDQVRKKRSLIAIYPGRDEDEHRVWSIGKWIKLIEKIKKYDKSTEFSIIGGGDCKKRTREIIEKTGNRVHDRTELKLSETVEEICKSRVFITTNGGPMQLAFAAKADMIAIHGPSPKMWMPHARNIINITSVKRYPESNDPNVFYTKEEFSVDRIKVDAVFSAFKKMIKRS